MEMPQCMVTMPRVPGCWLFAPDRVARTQDVRGVSDCPDASGDAIFQRLCREFRVGSGGLEIAINSGFIEGDFF